MSAICDAHEKKVDDEQLYNSVHRKFNQVVIRCGRENQHPAEGTFMTPDWAVAVGEKMLEWGTCPREARPPGPRLSSPGERERNAVMAIGVGVNRLQFCSVSNSFSHTTLSIKWKVDFLKELCRSSLLCRCYDSACICVCIVVHWLFRLPTAPPCARTLCNCFSALHKYHRRK